MRYRYLNKLEEVICQGRFVLPAAHALIKIADLFWTLELGSKVFWIRLTQELYKLLETDVLDTDEVNMLVKCIGANHRNQHKHQETISNEGLWKRTAS